MKRIISIIILITNTLYGLSAYSQHCDTTENSELKRSQWIETQSNNLKMLMLDSCSVVVHPQVIEIEDYYRISYRFTSPGCIRFDNGDTVFVTFNSSHDDPDTGDITLAVDNHSRLFVNYGHVCGGIIHFVVDQRVDIHSVDDFFRLTVSGTDAMPWNLLDD